MVKPGLVIALTALTALAAVPPVRALYNDAFAREQTVRAAMNHDDPAPSVLTGVRAVVARYEGVVRHYPASSYCDNALWQAALLELDAFTKFGQPQDRDAGARLLRMLASMYPTSKLAAQVPARLARLAADTPAKPQGAAQAPRQSAEPLQELPQVTDPPRPTVSDAPPLPAPRVAERRAEKPVERPAEKPADKADKLTEKAAEPARGSERAGIATVKQIRRTVLPDAVRIVIELDGEVDFRQDRIPNPSRVFVDLPGTRAAGALVDRTLRFESDADVVRQVRIGRHPNNVTRVVLDAAGVSSYSVYPLYAPYRLVIDCVREGQSQSTTGTLGSLGIPENLDAAPSADTLRLFKPAAPVRRERPLLPGRASTSVWLRAAPGNASQHTVLLAEAHAREVADGSAAARTATRLRSDPDAVVIKPLSDPSPEPIKPLSDAIASPPPVRNGGFTIARQLGLGVSRIVIDAGHGGHDPGAKAKGVVEAELVLDVTLRVEKLLQKVQGVEVVLTRRTDEFVALQERTAIANREGADLFLSIHANASASAQARGIETYFLNFATNLSAAAVAAR
jgi:N-acetylmuramoyl-L-alanine amidase